MLQILLWLVSLGLGAKERTTQEFESLFNKSGFILATIKKAEFQSVIEAVSVKDYLVNLFKSFKYLYLWLS